MPRQPYNADERSAEREQTPATIGGREFVPRRLTNTVMKTIRALAREGDTAQKAADAARRDAEQTHNRLLLAQGELAKPQTDDRRTEALRAEVERLAGEYDAKLEAQTNAEEHAQDVAASSVYRQVHHLLRDDQAQGPPIDFLEEHLDTRDVGDLLGWLMSDGDGGNSSTPAEETATPAATTT